MSVMYGVSTHSVSIVWNTCALPTINPLNFALHPKNIAYVFTHTELLFISSWHLRPWLETTNMPLSNSEHLFTQLFYLLMSSVWCFLQISIFLPLYIYRSCMMMSKCKLDRVDILHSFFALRYWMCVVTNTYPMMHCAQVFYTWVPVM